MRNMTAAELQAYYQLGICPGCGGKAFLEGPRGGLAQNIRCIHCELSLNIDSTGRCTTFGQVIHESTAPKP